VLSLRADNPHLPHYANSKQIVDARKKEKGKQGCASGGFKPVHQGLLSMTPGYRQGSEKE